VAVKIRLKRLGKIRSPHYRIVVMDSRNKRDGRAIEEIGLYHPKNDPSVIRVNSERAQYWLGVGAQPTEAVVAPVQALRRLAGVHGRQDAVRHRSPARAQGQGRRLQQGAGRGRRCLHHRGHLQAQPEGQGCS